MELEAHQIIARELGYLKAEELLSCQSWVERIGQMLNRLIHALRNRSRPANPENRIPNPD